MNTVRSLVLVAVIALASLGAQAQGPAPDPLQAGFQAIIDDLNDNNLDSFVAAIDQGAMLAQVFAQRLIDTRVKDGVETSFGSDVRKLFVESFPKVNGEILGKIVGFRRNGARATAVVRWDMPNFKFIYHEFDLVAGAKDRVQIVDWVDFGSGQRFSDGFGDALVTVVADQDATRSLLRPVSLTGPEAFQTSELLKAARDGKHARYFDILPGLDVRIQNHPVVAIRSLQMASASRDRNRYKDALATLAEYFPDNPLYATTLLDYYLPQRDYAAARAALLLLGERLGIQDPALKSHLATLSLLVGNQQDASDYAEAAAAEDPGLELAWWAVLRSRTANQRYDEAIDALDVLEGKFGHKLRTTALKQDRLLAQLMETDQFKSWAKPE